MKMLFFVRLDLIRNNKLIAEIMVTNADLKKADLDLQLKDQDVILVPAFPRSGLKVKR